MTTAFPVVEESSVRTSLADDISVCSQCRLCLDLCDVFPSIFAALEGVTDADPHLLTPNQQNIFSDSCFHCGACTQRCPHRGPDSEHEVDLPTTFIDLMQVRQLNGYFTVRQRITNWVLSAHDLTGPIASRCATFVNWCMQRPDTLRRRLVTAVTGISSSVHIPRISGQRFSTWFRRQPMPVASDRPQVSVFATCSVEYFSDDAARSVIGDLASRGRHCELATTRCCGAEELRAGRVRAFRKRVRRLTKLLGKESSKGPIMVMSPSCLAHLRTNLIPHCDRDLRPNAELIVDRLRSPIEVLTESTSAGTSRSLGTSDSRRSLLFLPGPHQDPSERTAIEHAIASDSTTIQVIADAGMHMGAWALRQGNEEGAHRTIKRMAKRLPTPTDAPRTVARSGLLSSQLLAHETGDDVVDPVTVLLSASSDEQ
ncbi:MAG: 4Fe-4S dicluster domain-containing protein [Ilumatobacteraceae bacterium]|nr:4Fe-4S dicluster domain-containing protein [Ilumatobacteraceae bacterium]